MTTSPVVTPTTYSLTYNARPWLINDERQKHFHKRAELVAEWRKAFKLLAKAERVPAMMSCTITVVHHRRNRASMPDVAACLPAAKAAIDSLTDAGCLLDDGPEHVTAVTFVAPVVDGRDALTLIITPTELAA